MIYLVKSLIFMFLLMPIVFSIIHENFCANHKGSLQCEIQKLMKEKVGFRNCDPMEKKDCHVNDFIHSNIASCHLANRDYQGVTGPNYDIIPNLKCLPKITVPRDIENERVVRISAGDPICVPTIYGKRIVCGERGTRCVCSSGSPGSFPIARFKCRCQWFIDYCTIPNICVGETSCDTVSGSLVCTGGAINQCDANPYLCQEKNAYCVELEDKNVKWFHRTEIEGEGFACFKKKVFKKMQSLAPFCNFNKTNHKLSGDGFLRPKNSLDYCCYRHLFCIEKKGAIGGYLFKRRPCYCNIEFRKCVQRVKDQNMIIILKELLLVIQAIKHCSLDDSGKCNPKIPHTCQKGDLVDPSLAHCAVNCKTGPLLPIELRSCRIRKCVPPNNLKNRRVVDVPYYKESSLCDAVRGLPITCGSDYTRCVCDGKPTFQYFTDGCRCQYWPPT